MKNTAPLKSTRRPGFTLVELLVVIAIVAVLALVAFTFARKGLQKAAASRAMSNLRQSGAILLSNAQENNGRLQYAIDADESESPYLPYNIVRKALDIEIVPEQTAKSLCEIMHWNAAKLKPTVYQKNCFGVNFTQIPADKDDPGVQWKEETISGAGNGIAVRTLYLSTVKRLGRYPILLDSSDSKGNEIFAIREESGNFPGMRNSGKANGFFLDGSSRELGHPELKDAGFNYAYDNSKKPPSLEEL